MDNKRDWGKLLCYVIGTTLAMILALWIVIIFIQVGQ